MAKVEIQLRIQQLRTSTTHSPSGSSCHSLLSILSGHHRGLCLVLSHVRSTRRREWRGRSTRFRNVTEFEDRWTQPINPNPIMEMNTYVNPAETQRKLNIFSNVKAATVAVETNNKKKQEEEEQKTDLDLTKVVVFFFFFFFFVACCLVLFRWHRRRRSPSETRRRSPTRTVFEPFQHPTRSFAISRLSKSTTKTIPMVNTSLPRTRRLCSSPRIDLHDSGWFPSFDHSG